MNTKKIPARVVCWRYWKQPQRFLEGAGQLSYTGFFIPKIQDYEYKHFFERNRIEVN
jgi:hypothetical protein